MKYSVKTSLSIFAVFSTFFLGSCEKKAVIPVINEEHVFSLEFGNFENQMNVFDVSSIGEIRNSIAMRDGFFFICNGKAKKVMEMNSYGDLLSIYYNSETNPEPSFYNAAQDVKSTRKAIQYPFNDISKIAVDSRKYLYAVDVLPVERYEKNEELGSYLSNIVLRFDGSGNFLNYIGQQGPGGTPFSQIVDIWATENNELVVLSRNIREFTVYWYREDGSLLCQVPVSPSVVPNPFIGEGVDAWMNIQNIVPDLHSRVLYIKSDFYVRHIDVSSKMQSGIDYYETLLFPLNIETGKYEKHMGIPPYREESSEGQEGIVRNIPYDFLGVTANGYFFFIISTESGFSVEVVQNDGQKIMKRNLEMNSGKGLFYTFNLSKEGILSIMKIMQDELSVDWWRTDSLIQAMGRK